MINDQLFSEVSPQAILADGTKYGELQVANAAFIFKVGQTVKVKTDSSVYLKYVVKEVPSLNIVILAQDGNVRELADLTYVVTSDNPTIRSDRQNRPAVTESNILRSVFEEAPTVAIRTMQVDRGGNPYSSDNPVPVVFATSSVTTPIVSRVAIPNANQEYSHTFPEGTKRFRFRVEKGGAEAKLTYQSGQSATNYWTVNRGAHFEEREIGTQNLTIYFQLDRSSQTVQIMSWK